jgi:iron complex outermembrane recepter protein
MTDRTGKQPIVPCVVLCALAATSPANLWAADAADATKEDGSAQSDGGPTEVVVTARRVNESLQKVPQAISALSSKDLSQLSVTNTADLSQVVPSVRFASGNRGGGIPFFAIRGISSADVNGAIDPPVGIYVNDVIQQRPNGLLSTYHDIESVQVLRGPQGTLFGRNTIAGAILINTRKPEKEFGGYAHLSAGNFNYRSIDAAVNVPFSDALEDAATECRL